MSMVKYIGPSRPGVDIADAGVFAPYNTPVTVPVEYLAGLLSRSDFVAADGEAEGYVPPAERSYRDVLVRDDDVLVANPGFEELGSPGLGGSGVPADDSITEPKLAPAVRTKLNTVASGGGVDLAEDLGPFAAGKGILLTSPDGNTVRRVRISNAGTLVTEDYAEGGGGDFDPTTVAGLIGWYDASALTGLSNGAPVGAWPDSSGAGRNLAQSGSARPTYVASGIGGLPSLDFDGSDDFLLQAAGTDAAVQMVFAVCYYTDSTFTTYAGLVTGPSDAVSNAGWLQGSQGSTQYYADPGSTSVYLDGTLSSAKEAPVGGTAGVSAISSATFGAAQVQVGNDRNTSRFWHGRIAEILLFDSVLSGTDRNTITAGLGSKYGITVAT